MRWRLSLASLTVMGLHFCSMDKWAGKDEFYKRKLDFCFFLLLCAIKRDRWDSVSFGWCIICMCCLHFLDLQSFLKLPLAQEIHQGAVLSWIHLVQLDMLVIIADVLKLWLMNPCEQSRLQYPVIRRWIKDSKAVKIQACLLSWLIPQP